MTDLDMRFQESKIKAEREFYNSKEYKILKILSVFVFICIAVGFGALLYIL